MQTKEQAIGYILKACLDSELPAKRIKEVARVAEQMIPIGELLEEEDTKRYLLDIIDQLELGEELESDLRNSLFWAYDLKTEEAAGKIFDSFVDMWPVQ